MNKESVKAVASQQLSATELEAAENVHFGFFDEDGAAVTAAETPDSPVVVDIIELGELLTIKTVADIKRRIEQSLMQQREIALDSADLRKIDTAGLQMLFSLQRSMIHSQQKINWKFRNPIIDSAAKLCGLEEITEGVSADHGVVEVAPQQNSSTGSAADNGFGFF